LKWNAADGAVREKRFFKPVAIGRGLTNDIDLDDDRVSRHHAVLWAEEGSWRVRDLDSANGTYLHHTMVKGTMVLPQSCELRFHANGPIVPVHVDVPAETRVG
jgi:pSer/pThr/pTyr-binding forkhead associated (FHA) protein